MAGAAAELGEALIINPNNREQISWSIKYALNMPDKIQKKRNQIMQKAIEKLSCEKMGR